MNQRLRRGRGSFMAFVAVVVFATTTTGIGSSAHAELSAATRTPVMGASILNADELARWFNANRAGREQPRLPALNNDVHALAQIFLDEGARENVRGDIAFAQSVIETGWFVFSDNGQIRPEFNNYAGINASNGRRKGTTCADEVLDAPLLSRCFPTPQIGVRAQIQLLRGYADPSSRYLPDRLRMPPSDRIGLAPWWEWFGGNSPTGKLIWASAPDYGIRILQLYSSVLTFNGHAPLGLFGTNPIGAVDAISRVPGGLRVSGWTIDPQTADPIAVTAWNNGLPTTFTTDVQRPDLAQIYPAYGALPHGFDRVVPAPAGTYNACVAGENVGAGTSSWLGCRTVTVSNQPQGVLDSVQATFRGATVAGWALDPDTADSIDVHLYVDGAFNRVVPATQTRPDIAAAFSGYGAPHGFSASVPMASGNHQLCAYAIGKGPGVNSLFGCSSVTVSGQPIGATDDISRRPGGLRVAGWAIDPDTTGPIAVIASTGQSTALLANGSRPDVAAAVPGLGDQHGFDQVVPASSGNYLACLTAMNTGDGGNTTIGCRSVAVSNAPAGRLDIVQPNGNQIDVLGWALDWDTANPIDVHLYLDGQFGQVVSAASSRPDVGAVFPGYGNAHGFVASLPATAGPHQVCAYAINSGAGAVNVALGCTNVVV
jgi:hypothetical protein